MTRSHLSTYAKLFERLGIKEEGLPVCIAIPQHITSPQILHSYGVDQGLSQIGIRYTDETGWDCTAMLLVHVPLRHTNWLLRIEAKIDEKCPNVITSTRLNAVYSDYSNYTTLSIIYLWKTFCGDIGWECNVSTRKGNLKRQCNDSEWRKDELPMRDDASNCDTDVKSKRERNSWFIVWGSWPSPRRSRDYLRPVLVPISIEITAGSNIPKWP